MSLNLALRYRPKRFIEVAGQTQAVKVLRELALRRLDLRVVTLSGQFGIGKTTLSRLYAKLINCENPNEEPCGQCPSCKAMEGGRHTDYIEMDMGCVGLGTYVPTDTGFSRIEELHKEHSVQSYVGTKVEFDEVERRWDGKKGKLLKLRMAYGLPLVCSEDHNLEIWEKSPGGRYKSKGLAKVVDLREGQYLCRPKELCFRLVKNTEPAVRYARESVKINERLRWRLKDVNLPVEMSHALAWLMGYVCGDGCILERGVHFYVLTERENLRIRQSMLNLFGMKPKEYFTGAIKILEYDSVYLSRYWFYLQEHFLLLYGSFYESYIAGWSQVDGTELAGTSVNVSTSNEDKMEKLVLMAQAIGAKTQIGFRKRNSSWRKIRGKGKSVSEEFRVTISIEKKLDTDKHIGKGMGRRRGWIERNGVVLHKILSITEIGEGGWFDLTVKKNHSFMPMMYMGHNSRGLVADVRKLRDEAIMFPTWKARVFTLDEIQSASKEAFNALLKILEEPPAHVSVCMCTTNLGQVPYAIVSRSLVLHLQPLEAAVVADRLLHVAEAEKIGITQEVAMMLGRNCSGSMRDAYMMLERLAIQGRGEVTKEVLESEVWFVSDKNAADLVKSVVKRDRDGFDVVMKQLSSRLSYEVLVREALRKLSVLYVARNKQADYLTSALWRAYLRLRRGAEPEVSMEGLWLETRNPDSQKAV